MQDLTKEQNEAVTMSGKRCCLIAGAGSGKTHTLTARIARDAMTAATETMVVVTFTNAAANELRERLHALALQPERFRHIGTLHSWATKEAFRLGVHAAIATPKQIGEATTFVKKRLGAMARNMSSAEIWRWAIKPPPYGNGRAAGIAMRNALLERGLTHHDLILAGFAEAVAKGRVNAPARIYVDEYQDSAPVDAEIYNLFGILGASLYFIGDPRQSIYGFRGATPLNLAQAWDRADARALLTSNFRSAPEICEFASDIAWRMEGMDFGIHLTAARDRPGTVERFSYQSEPEEMLAAREWVERHQAAGKSVAVLARYNAQAKAAAMILRAAGIATTCSADTPEADPKEDLATSIAKIQTFGHIATSPEAWQRIMTHLGVPFANQDALMPDLKECRTPSALASLGTASEPLRPQEGTVAVATIHAAKGLEWDSVWLMGADQNAFRAGAEDQEAGRMLYVAITRARRHMAISHAASRPQPESGKLLTNQTLTSWLATA